jgi:hypothetical protein
VNLWEIYNHSQQFQEEGNSYYNKRAHVEDAGEMDVVKKQMRFHRDSGTGILSVMSWLILSSFKIYFPK